MSNKRPIDVLRDSGRSVNIGSKDDGAVTEMCDFGGKLIIIKEKSIYDLVFADDIDPNRENPNLPPSIQRLILNFGSDSEMICRTFLTARQLFKKEYFPDNINLDSALSLVFEATKEMVAMHEEIDNYISEETRLFKEYEERKGKELPFILPSISDVNTRCKTIFQKADHVLNGLLEIIRLFYADFKKEYFPKFYEYILHKYGESDSFTQFLKIGLPHFWLIRNIRNCLDHRNKELIIKDYELKIDSNIISPTIEINYNGSKLDQNSLAAFLLTIEENMIIVFEDLIAHLCNKNVIDYHPISFQISYVPPEKRTNKFIQYDYEFIHK